MENDKSQDLWSDSAGWRLTGVDGAFLTASPRSGPSLSAVQAEEIVLLRTVSPSFVLFRPSAVDQAHRHWGGNHCFTQPTDFKY